MTTIDSQRILAETGAAREKAESLLNDLLDAKRKADRHLNESRRVDAMAVVTGRSAMDTAIASTRQMIERLDHTMERVRSSLSSEEIAELEALDVVGAAVDAGGDGRGIGFST